MYRLAGVALLRRQIWNVGFSSVISVTIDISDVSHVHNSCFSYHSDDAASLFQKIPWILNGFQFFVWELLAKLEEDNRIILLGLLENSQFSELCWKHFSLHRQLFSRLLSHCNEHIWFHNTTLYLSCNIETFPLKKSNISYLNTQYFWIVL